MNIIDTIGLPAVLEQLAEESSELSKAALKVSRILRKENPTPITLDKALADLDEEANDVRCVLMLLSAKGYAQENCEIICERICRWTSRLREAGKT